MAYRFKVKFLDGKKREECQLMEQLNSVVPLILTDCVIARDGANLAMNSIEDLDKLLSEESETKLNELHLKITPPINYRSERTVFVPKPRPFITNKTHQALIHSINNSNDDLVSEAVAYVRSINHKQGDRLNLKVTFKAFDSGFFVGRMLIPSEYVFMEDFVRVTQCIRCFSFQHTVNFCPAPQPFCSYCDGNHNHSSCPDKEDPSKLKCHNCSEKHLAVSAACIKRKEVIKSIRDARRAKAANAGSSNLPTTSGGAASAGSTAMGFSGNSGEGLDRGAIFPSLPKSKPNAWTAPVLSEPSTSYAHVSGIGVSHASDDTNADQTNSSSRPAPLQNVPSQSDVPLADQFKSNEWKVQLYL